MNIYTRAGDERFEGIRIIFIEGLPFGPINRNDFTNRQSCREQISQDATSQVLYFI